MSNYEIYQSQFDTSTPFGQIGCLRCNETPTTPGPIFVDLAPLEYGDDAVLLCIACVRTILSEMEHKQAEIMAAGGEIPCDCQGCYEARLK